jgi:hypothetical protein
MKAVLTIVFAGFLIWPVPAGAKTYSLTVSVHKDVAELTRSEAKAILKRASRIMHAAKCNVKFTLSGSIGRFDAPGAKEITTEAQRDAVHNVKANVKIVDKIGFCFAPGVFRGCAFPTEQPPGPPGISIILTRNEASLANRWAHEVGHRMGLSHRQGLEKKPLMTACTVEPQSVELTKRECKCFLEGPLSCGKPEVVRCPN